VPPEAVPEAVTLALELPVLAPSDLEHIRRAASLRPANLPPVRMHLGVETGMGRGGLPLAAVAAAAAKIEAHPALELAGIWSHLHSPGETEASALQRLRLEEAAAAIAAAGIVVPPRHLAATGGIFAGGGLALDLVRPGVALHGLVDDDICLTGTAAEAARRLRPTMAIKARALAFSDVPIGGTVGYGGTWRAERPSRVAVLPVGYGDGYLRASQPGAAALVLGRRVPLVGRVSMDAVTADVTDLPAVDGGDEFVLLGAQGPERIGAGELARRRNTIAREVLAAMAPRLTRVYHPVAETPGIGNDASGG
jgi:alanine racemase